MLFFVSFPPLSRHDHANPPRPRPRPRSSRPVLAVNGLRKNKPSSTVADCVFHALQPPDEHSSFPLLHLLPATIKSFFRKIGGGNLKMPPSWEINFPDADADADCRRVLESWGRRGGAIYVVVRLREVNFSALQQPSTGKVGARGPNIP